MTRLPGLVKPNEKLSQHPAIPAAHDSILLLAQIRDAINQLTQSGMQEDYSDYRDVPMSTAAGSELIAPDGQIGWLYIPDAPRDLSIFAGMGRGRILGTVTKGSYARFQIPKGQAVSVEWGTGATDATLSYWVSSRPIDYAAINPDMLSDTSGLVAAVHAEDSALASGDYGIAAWGVAKEDDALLADAGDYMPVGINRAGWQMVTALRNSAPLNTDGVSAGMAFYNITNARNSGFGGALNLLYNGATIDRARGNVDGTALASLARTAETSSPDIINYNGRGVWVWLDVTAASGTGGLTLNIDAKDPVSGGYFRVNTIPTAVTTTGLRLYLYLPGAATGGNVTQANQMGVPRTFRVRVGHGDGTSYTYSVGYCIAN